MLWTCLFVIFEFGLQLHILHYHIMKKFDAIKYRDQFLTIGPINHSQTVLLATRSKTTSQKQINRYIVKVINFEQQNRHLQNSDLKVYMQDIQSTISRLQRSNMSIMYKLDSFAFDDNKLYLISQILPLSLQNLLLYHKSMNQPISPWFLHNFGIKMYESINRVKKSNSEFYHKNLKPSNIFIQFRRQGRQGRQSQPQLQLKLTQFGIITKHPNKFYHPIIQPSIKSKTNISTVSLQYDTELYALGIMMIQLTTLLPIDEIYYMLGETQGIEEIKSKIMRYQQKVYQLKQNQLVNFVMGLLENKQSFKLSVDKFKQCIYQYKILPDYKNQSATVQWSIERFQKIVKDRPYQIVSHYFQKAVKQQNISCEKVIRIAEKLDPLLYFKFYDYNKLDIFLKNFDIQLKQNQMIQLHFVMRQASAVNYMEIVKKAYSAQQVMQAIIFTNIKHYDSKKMFFEEKSQHRDFWRAEDITRYLHDLGVFLDQREVQKVVQAWTPQHRDSIKYSQFVKVFRSNDEEQTPMKNRMKSQAGQDKHLYDMMNSLRKVLLQDNLNLVNFFRASDFKGKWIVGPQIQKQIKKKISVDQKTFKYCLNQMFDMAGIGTQKRYIHYINLIKFLRIYSQTQLFKMILVEMINNTNHRQFYRKYEKDDKGWNRQSLINLNQNEMLQFGESELNMIFHELDKDKSKYLSEKQLIYILTGLEQFDKDFIIEKIKNEAQGKWDLFEVFMRFDINKDLYLDKPGELAKVFDFIGVNISAEHCKDLFINGMRSEKFPYLQFLRNFIPNSKLFLKACMFYIDHFYNGNFEKFYDMGRVKNKKKWGFESFNQINEELLFGFTYNEMSAIWQTLNPEKQQSLTKEEVAKIFNCSYQPEQNILGLNTVEKSKEKQSNLSDKKPNQQESNKKNIQSSPLEKKQVKDKNQLAQSLIQRKLPEVALCFIRKSRQNGQLAFSTFCQCLDELKIKYLRNVVMKNTSQFQSIEPVKNTMKVNFVSFLMYVCQLQEQGKEQKKTQCLAVIIKEIMKFDNLTSEDIFKKCRKPGTMRLTDYENFVKDIIKSEVYFDDIEDTWKFWGSPDYITIDEFNKMFNASSFETNQYKKQPEAKLRRQFSFSPQQMAKQILQDVSSPGFPAALKDRKQSKDEQQRYPNRQKQRERQREKQKEKQKERQKERQREKQKERLGFKRTDSGEIQVPRKDKYETEKQFKINTLSPRDIKNNYQSSRQIQLRKQKQKEEQQKRKEQSKNIALDRFQKKIKQKGSDYLNDLFSRTNAVSFQQFCRCLQDKYGMDPTQCQQLNENFNSFGKVKIQTIKKYIRRIESPEKQREDQLKQQRDGKRKQPFSMSKKNISKEKQKNQKQKPEDNQNLKLEDPRKMKLNIPLIEQHIKILVSSFAKRFDVNQMQPFFFDGNTSINKEDFIKKCVEVNPSISKSMYQKIFLYLKPKANVVSSISFKLSFTYDHQIQMQEAYFPEEIEQEIKTIFERADKDKSGFIQFNEIQQILNTLGFNQTQKQIQNYFQKIDQNFDKKISIKQFKFFIEDNILPFISDFDEDVDNLTGLFKMNDVYRTGYLPVVTVGAVLDRYGVKLGERDLNVLNSFMKSENGEISIKQLIRKLYFPAQETNSALKALLYRIRWKRKITLKDVQKIFQNISASFIMSFTSQVIKNKTVTPSTFITPVLNQSRLFYNDFYYKNMSKLDPKSANLINFSKPNDLIVEIKLIDAYGIPIPQNAQIKNGILNRSVNVTFYDTSTEQAKDCMLNLQVEFDPDVEDQWVFNKNNRSIFVKIANYEPRKYQKVFMLFQFLVTLVDGQKSIDISCGTASFPIKQLQVEAKTVRKYKMIAGIPNKSKDIDKMSISKRKGWRGFIGSGEVQSEFQIQIFPQSKIQDKIEQICAMPEKSIVNRKALSIMWVFRQYFAFKAIDQKRVNPDFGSHFVVRTFLLCLDIPDVNEELYPFWKDKIQPKTSAIQIACQVFHCLMIDLNVVIHSKQFELLPSYPSKSTFSNKTLKNTRKKYLQDVFANIEEWVLDDPRKQYRRRRAYNMESTPFIVEQREMTAQVRHISQQLMKIK